MALQAHYKKLTLEFKTPVLTSRGEMKYKNGLLLFVSDGKKTGVGECSFIEGLSRDNLEDIEEAMQKVCDCINEWESIYDSVYLRHPAICFAVESALLDLKNGGNKMLFENNFSKGKAGIPINGLIWMGTKEFMMEQLKQKQQHGFSCIKMKIGAIDFNEECEIIEYIRSHFSADKIELRLDANGAFEQHDVFRKLERLSRYKIHSIEQPIKPNQWSLMRAITDLNLIDIALDEELIGITDESLKEALLIQTNPKYIILKPSLIGGLKKSEEWIQLAGKHNIGWWATSALESNVGLNAIAQWVYNFSQDKVQGLGTGLLYTNNIQSPLEVVNGELIYNSNLTWAAI
jgi:o-succinylbenzoate synthase